MSLRHSLSPNDDTPRPHPDSRGQIQLVGFMIMVSMFVIGGLFLFVSGVVLFQDAASQKPFTAAHHDMQEIKTSIHDLQTGAPYRQATLSRTPGTLGYGTPTTITVRARLPSGSYDEIPGCTTGWCTLATTTTRPITYHTPAGNLKYISGALITTADTTSTTDRSGHLTAPGPWTITPQSTQITVIGTQHAGGPTSIGVTSGPSTSRITVELVRRAVNSTAWNPVDTTGTPQTLSGQYVVQNTTTPYAWKMYFQQSDTPFTYNATASTPTTGTVVADFQTTRLLVRNVSINVTYAT